MPDFRKLSFTQRENEITNSTTRPARILLSGDNSTCPMYRRVIMKSNSLYIPLTKSGSPEDSSWSAESCRKRSHSFLRRTGFSVSSAIEGGVELRDYIKEMIKKKCIVGRICQHWKQGFVGLYKRTKKYWVSRRVSGLKFRSEQNLVPGTTLTEKMQAVKS